MSVVQFCTDPSSDGPVAVVRVAVADLRPGIQLRAGAINHDHVEALTLSEHPWEPILVRRGDNAIVDGHYRYLAALELGHSHIDCVFFEGSPEAAFLEALRRNRDHGLPLTLKDRQAAACRLMSFHPDWSDRALATVCGLSQGTIGRLRATMPATNVLDEPEFRVGRDGRRRPVDRRASRARIIEALRAQPNESLRGIARLTGTSPATVLAVRTEQRRLELSEGDRTEADQPTAGTECPEGPAPSPEPPPPRWMTDQALASTANGETLAIWLERTALGDEWEEFVLDIPVSRIYEVADEARRRGQAWLNFAEAVEIRVRSRQPVRSTCQQP